LKITTSTFNLLYSVYSYPNTVLPIFGGIFLDIIGLRLGILVFSGILTIGQGVFMIGGYQKSFGIMIAGRVIFGFGGESLSVAQSAIVSKWFKGKELAMALGLNISISRLGSVINGMIVPKIYDN
jgi:MFS family permease